MSKSLIITEKPSVARDIAKVLNCRGRRDGFIEGEDYLITWAVGHLITLCEPDDYDVAFKKWQYQMLPIVPDEIKTKPYPKTKSQLHIIKRLVDREDVTNLVCATDSGREGELIFRYIYTFLKCEKPFKRLWISSMTDEAIKKGFETLKGSEHYDNLYMSAKCRSEADWLVGINATRAYTTLNHVLLSVGRVQTPTLALIVNRQLEIKAFKPKDYYEVTASFGDFSGTWYNTKPSDTKIMVLEEAEAIKEKVIDKEGTVTKIDKKKKKEKPPLLYDLTELQRDGNKIFSYSAKEVLTIAQDLYEKHKMLTYPRTDSRYLSDDMKSVVKQTLTKMSIPPYDKAIAPVLSKELNFTKRIIDNKKVTDHHAIIPTNVKPNTSRLNPDELNIYNLVAKRLIAVFYDDFIYETTTITVDVEEEKFASKGKIILQKGWKALYKASKDDKEQEMPPMAKRDTLKVVEAELLTKKTSPPKPYTEASLLSAMENAGRFVEEESLKEQLKESGFGTAATRAGIIERLLQVKYIFRKGKSLHATEKGEKLIQIIPEEMKSPETTGRWEKGLNKINQGELDADKFMSSIKRFVGYIVQQANMTKHSVVFPEEDHGKGKAKTSNKDELGKCPMCEDGVILEHKKGFFCSNWQRRDCKMTIWKNQLEKQAIEINTAFMKEILKKTTIDVGNYKVTIKRNHLLVAPKTVESKDDK